MDDLYASFLRFRDLRGEAPVPSFSVGGSTPFGIAGARILSLFQVLSGALGLAERDRRRAAGRQETVASGRRLDVAADCLYPLLPSSLHQFLSRRHLGVGKSRVE